MVLIRVAGRTVTTTKTTSIEITTFKTALQADHIMVSRDKLPFKKCYSKEPTSTKFADRCKAVCIDSYTTFYWPALFRKIYLFVHPQMHVSGQGISFRAVDLINLYHSIIFLQISALNSITFTGQIKQVSERNMNWLSRSEFRLRELSELAWFCDKIRDSRLLFLIRSCLHYPKHFWITSIFKVFTRR